MTDTTKLPAEVRDAIQEYRSALATVFYDTTPMSTGFRMEDEARTSLDLAITRALEAARRGALEEAASLADEGHCGRPSGCVDTACLTAKTIADRIRSLTQAQDKD